MTLTDAETFAVITAGTPPSIWTDLWAALFIGALVFLLGMALFGGWGRR